ncbi:MAG: hypothetical protein AB9883_00385 [Acidaminococcaceae bacterium]
MKKYSSLCYFVLSMTFMITSTCNNNASAKEYKSTFGNYSISIPENTIPISEGPTSYRFAQGNINIECNILSLPPELQTNKKNIGSNDIITKLDDLLLSSIADRNYQNTNSSWQKYKNKELLYQIFENKSADNLNKEKLLADTIFINSKNIFVISAFAPNSENEKAAELLATILNSAKINDAKEPKNNYFTNNAAGYALNLPNGWNNKSGNTYNIIQLQKADNLVSGSIRTFTTNEYAQYAKAAEPELSKLENQFIERMTKYTTSQGIIAHKPININGLNGILIEKTISKQDDATNVLECYLFTASKGYQINFSSKDKKQYDASKKSFLDAIASFKTLGY